MDVKQNGEPLQEVDYFKYLGQLLAADGGCERDVVHRMNRGIKMGRVEKFAEQQRI